MAPATSKGRQNTFTSVIDRRRQQPSLRSNQDFRIAASRDLPENWMAMTLTDAAVVVGGGTPKRSEPAYWNGDVPWATPTDVAGLSGRTISETASSITEAGLASSSARLLPPNSLLMTTRATIGACAINLVAMATNQGFQNLVPKRSNVCVDFLYYLIKYHAGRLEQLAAGSTFLEISKRSVGSFRVHMPPISEQRKIAAILSSVDDAIEMTQAVIDQAQIVKRGLMQELLKQEPDANTLMSSNVGSLAQVNPEQLGSRTDPDYLMEYLDISAIEQPGVIGDTRKFRFEDAPSRARRVVREGDILVSTVRPYLRNFARVREAPNNLVVSTGYAVVRPGDRVDGRFLYQHILSTGFVDYLKPRMSGSNYPAVTANHVRLYPIVLPTLSEQHKIADILSSVDDTIEQHRRFVDRAQIAKRGLMSVLLTGELRVNPDTVAA